MSVTLQDFVKRLDESGLMKISEVRRFCRSFPRELRPRDVQSLARELVRFGKITKYQASRIHRGRHRSLVLGNYVILRKIGRGGMGDVYQAEHRRMKRIVAVKVLPKSMTKSERAMKRFSREVEVAAKLIHPNIVTAYDADEANGAIFLVMEYVDGIDLAAQVDNNGPMQVVQAVDCILQAAKGLQYAHNQGVIHRDIKPHNLLMDGNGHVKVLDMGLVFLDDERERRIEEEITRDNQIVGTVDYMSPEQAEDTRRVDHRTDMYSLGCSMHRLIIGTPPFRGETSVQKILAHREQDPPPLLQRTDVPRRVEAIYQRLMKKNRDERFGSMAEVVTELESILATEFQPSAIADSRAVIALDEDRYQDDADTAFMKFVSSVDADAPRPDAMSEGTIDRQSGQSTISALSVQSPSHVRRRRGTNKWVVPLMVALTLVVILGLMFMAKWFSQPTQVVIKWPVTQRRDAHLLVNDREYELTENPIVVPLMPGKHTIVMMRRGYEPIRHEITLSRGHEMRLPMKWIPLGQRTPD